MVETINLEPPSATNGERIPDGGRCEERRCNVQLIRILDDIATDLEQQTRAIRDAATAASEVEDSADEQAAAVHARLIVMWNWCRHYAKQLEARQ
jgi:hypothetical protein